MLHNTLDTQISKLHAERIGATINQASIISYEDEYQLLRCKVMSFEILEACSIYFFLCWPSLLSSRWPRV